MELTINHAYVMKPLLKKKKKKILNYRVWTISELGVHPHAGRITHSNSMETEAPVLRTQWTLSYVPLHLAVHLYSL